MKIKCTNLILESKKITNYGVSNGSLTIGKEYIVLTVSADNIYLLGFRIECDEGELIMPDASNFELVSNYIPSNWEIKFSTNKYNGEDQFYLSLAPRKWNEARYNIDTSKEQSFYEEVILADTPLYKWKTYPKEERPDVINLYLQEKELIEQEELAYEKSKSSGTPIKTSTNILNWIKGSNIS